MTTLLLASLLLGQATAVDAETEKIQQKKWNDYYAKVAADYEIARGKDGQAKLKLQPEAVLSWSNPVRAGETNGSVFVWTHEGRAELVGTIFSHLVRNKPDQKIIAHEFQSLTNEPLAGERPGQPGTWSLVGDGVTARPIPDAPLPAQSRAGRLSQNAQPGPRIQRDDHVWRRGARPAAVDPANPSQRERGGRHSGWRPLHVRDRHRSGAEARDRGPAAGERKGRRLALHCRSLHRSPLETEFPESRALDAPSGETIDGRPDPYIAARYETLPKVME